MAVDGKIVAKEIYITVDPSYWGWPDYVFESNYKPMSLQQLEQYVKVNKHLPEVPSAKEVSEQGISVSEMNKALLKRMEEMTLHMIRQQKEIDNLKAEVQAFKK